MTATFLFKFIIIAAIGTGIVNGFLHDREAVTLLNTSLNAASWYLLIQAQRRLRTEVAPKLEHVEEQIAAVAEQVNTPPAHAIEGGRRQYDPPPCEGH